MAVHTRKDGRVICYYRDKESGKTVQEYFGKGAAAETAALARNKELGLGKRKTINHGVKFGELHEVYANSRNFSLNSLKHLRIRLEANILPFFGQKVAKKIDDQDMDDYVQARRRKVRKYKNGKKKHPIKFSTISRELTDVKAILNFAASRKPPLIPFNPVRDYKKPATDDESIIPPTIAEAEAIMAAAAKNSPHLVRAIVLSYYLGLRPGGVELLTLNWASVNWESLTIRVMSAHKGGPEKRNVPINENFVELLRSWWKQDRKKGPIIHYRGRQIKRIQSSWAGALKRAKIGRRIRPYDMRHHFVTKALEEGADIKPLAEIVGSRPETLMRHYQHVTRNVHRKTIAKIPAITVPELPEKRSKKK